MNSTSSDCGRSNVTLKAPLFDAKFEVFAAHMLVPLLINNEFMDALEIAAHTHIIVRIE